MRTPARAPVLQPLVPGPQRHRFQTLEHTFGSRPGQVAAPLQPEGYPDPPPGVFRPVTQGSHQLVFEVTQDADGGFVAECLSESIFTQADDWEGLRRNVKEAVDAFFFDRTEPPSRIRLHLIRDEVLAQP